MRVVEDALDDRLLLGVHPEAVHGERLLFLVEQAQTHAFGVDRRDGRDADVENVAVGLEVDAAVLRQPALRDVEARHDLEARDDRVLEAQKVLRQRHRHEQAVDPVADAQLALLRFEMDVRRGVSDGLADDVAHESHDGGIGIHDLVRPLGILHRSEVLAGILEAARADAKMLQYELVDAVRLCEMPPDRPRRECAHPVEDSLVWRPRSGEMKDGSRIRRGGCLGLFRRRAGGVRAGDGDRHDLVIVHQAGGQEGERSPVGPDVGRDLHPGGAGDKRQHVALGQGESRDNGGDPLASRRLEHRLPLLLSQPVGKRGREGLLYQLIHDVAARCGLIASAA